MDNRVRGVPHSFFFYPKAYALIGVLSAVSPVGEAAEVLLIGDSISLEYWVRVQNGSSPADNVFHINENALTSSNGVAKIDSWLDSPHYWDAPLGEVVAVPPRPWNIIHFNLGLHDITRLPDKSGPPATTVSDYSNNLRAIIGAMRAHSPSATLIFATSTPILAQPNRLVEDVSLYNAAAATLMEEEGIFVNDLYTEMLPFVDEYSRDGTHFTAEGSTLNAQNVVSAINSVPEPSGALQTVFSTLLLLRRRR